jgi:hypothetical protein
VSASFRQSTCAGGLCHRSAALALESLHTIPADDAKASASAKALSNDGRNGRPSPCGGAVPVPHAASGRDGFGVACV